MNTKLFSTLMLLSILLAGCNGTTTPVPTAAPFNEALASGVITAEGTLLPEQSAELAFAQGGVVKEILIQHGEQVVAGAVIARLIGFESVQAELAAAQLEQTLAQQALDALQRDALLTSSQTEQALLTAQEAYESEANGWNLGNEDEATDLELRLEDYIKAEADYRDARQKLDDVLYLDKDDHKREDAQVDFDTEKENLAVAYADLKNAVAGNARTLDEEITALLGVISRLESAREFQGRLDDSNLDSEILAVAEARLETAMANVVAAESALEFYELRAPFNGELVALDLTVGETALPMTPIAFVADTSKWIVETKDLAEVDIVGIAVGDSVSLKLDVFPDEEFTGKVAVIERVGKLYLGDMTYQVTVALDQPDPRFLWNMTAIVNVNSAGD